LEEKPAVPSLLTQMLTLLSRAERRHTAVLTGMIVGMAVVEVAGVASIMPFMAVLGNPEMVDTNRLLAWAYARGGFADTDAFLLALGLLVMGALVFSTMFSALTTWRLLRFVHMREHSISRRLFRQYLGQPYPFFFSRNSTDLAKNLFTEVALVINGVFVPAMNVLARGIVVVLVVALLIAADPALALSTAVAVGGAYGVIYAVARRQLARTGLERVRANEQRFRVASEAFGGIKEIKLLGNEKSYADHFGLPSCDYARYQSTNHILAQVPRYFLEAAAFGGLMAIALVLIRSGRDLGSTLPLLSLYAVAAYRLMPALNHIYGGLAKIRFNRASLDALHRDVVATVPPPPRPLPPPLPFRERLVLHGLGYRYPGTSEPALEEVDVEIPCGAMVGIVGPTGAGKSTLVDVILGLLTPTAGRITVDGTELTDANRPAWQRRIGYVPQQIFLADDTVARNIAFGVPAAELDPARVEAVARVAALDRFVEEELPDGYDTPVGEDGVRLSGGQRQRIGIARALYRDPAVLVLDEATSALDTVTEQRVMTGVHGLGGQKTVILIAHRLSTVRACDIIFILERGKVLAMGGFDELMQTSAQFTAMVEAG